MSKRVGPVGNYLGDAFDDGVFDGVKKIIVSVEGSPYNCISMIKIEYEKDGKLESRQHGTVRGELKEFIVDHPNEYITSVGGSYDIVRTYYQSLLIKSLIFKTNTGRASPVLGGTTESGQPAGTEFTLEGKYGEKLLGFFGRAGQALDAIGAYLGPWVFSVNYPEDNIVSVGGTYNHIFNYDTTLITSLYFTTSKGFTSPLFGVAKGKDFELQGESGEKLRGIYGRGGTAIDAIGAHFGPLGGNKGNTFDDGFFDGVKKLTIGADEYSIVYMKIEYQKDGKVIVREHGTFDGILKEFSVNYPEDNIVAVGGSYNHIFKYDTTLITSLYFTTSKGFTSPLFGVKKGKDFELKGENGGKLLGIYGRDGTAIDAIGAHFETGSG
uniref:Jacalin-type lectin domain-containing protein n=1 Tax=Brassica campestris TaxID=3711 RepID=M4DQZ9_BRACM